MKVMLPEFECAGVMVVGDVMLDCYWYGPTSCISLEALVPVVKVNTIEECLGGVANVVMNIASLGANACLVGLMGIDDAVCVLSKSLADVNVKCDFVSVLMYLTITKLWVLSCNQQLICLDFEEGFEGVDLQLLHEWINQVLSLIGVLVLSDYAKGVLASVQQMIQLACKVGVLVLIDPKGTDFECYCGAMLLMLNLLEFEAVVGKCKTEEEIVERGMKLIADYELLALLVTCSEQGMLLLQLGKALLHMPTQAQEVYDVTGVGDMVIGVLVAMLAVGNLLEEACFFANVVAGVVVGKLGTSMVSLIELENAVCGCADTGFGVMTEEELKLAVVAACKCGEKVVMTNGVFDILHAGHVSYLANACKLGDCLIVAVNSDASTKWLKGDSCPVNLLEQCMIVLGALEVVDWVVLFEEDMLQCLIAGILPDLLVKGGDYKPEEIAGSKEVWANGGEVLVLNFEDGCLMTNIIKKIQQDKKG